MQADVNEIFELPNVASQLLSLQSETNSACQKARHEAEQILDETQREERNSLQLLNTAREIEEAAQAAMVVAEGVMTAAEARLAAAVAEEAAAVASGNPVAIAGAAAEVVAAQQAYQQARQAYEMARQAYEVAKAHRELLEKRYEMAKQAVNLAQMMKSKLEMNCMKCLAQVAPLVEQGVSRITQAHSDLQQYHAESTRVSNFQQWQNYQPKIGQPVKPPEINSRLNPSAEVMKGLLENRYKNDPNFKALVDSYREQAKTNRGGVETQIKRNMAGKFAEEIVKDALKPYGGVYQTQGRVDLPDGSYTKPDFILQDLKVPMIFGKGEGMGVREKGSIGIEVKTGQENYFWRQREHLEQQAKGHVHCDASWTICSRDVQELEADKQRTLRSDIRNAGSPIIGVLPKKEDLDKACLNFVFGENKK